MTNGEMHNLKDLLWHLKGFYYDTFKLGGARWEARGGKKEDGDYLSICYKHEKKTKKSHCRKGRLQHLPDSQ